MEITFQHIQMIINFLYTNLKFKVQTFLNIYKNLSGFGSFFFVFFVSFKMVLVFWGALG